MRDKLTVLQCAHSNGEVNTLGDTTIELHDLSMNHAHVYFDPAQRDDAIQNEISGFHALRTAVGRRFRVRLGSVHDVPVGPHPKGIFQIVIANDQFGIVVPWLMINRRGLDVLLHPETGDDLADHTRLAIWMGQPLPPVLDAF